VKSLVENFKLSSTANIPHLARFGFCNMRSVDTAEQSGPADRTNEAVFCLSSPERIQFFGHYCPIFWTELLLGYSEWHRSPWCSERKRRWGHFIDASQTLLIECAATSAKPIKP